MGIVSYTFITVALVLAVLLAAQTVFGQSEQTFRLESVDFNVSGDHGPYTILSHSGFDSYEATSTEPKLTVDIDSDLCYWNRIVVLISETGERATVNIVVEQPCYLADPAENALPSTSGSGNAVGSSPACPNSLERHMHNSGDGEKHGHVALGNLPLNGSNHIPHKHTYAWSPEVQDCNTQFMLCAKDIPACSGKAPPPDG